MSRKKTTSSNFFQGMLVGELAVFLLLMIIGRFSPIKVEAIPYNQGDERFEKYMALDITLEKIASRKYIVDKYNCVDFSKDLVKELESIGIKAEVIHGIAPLGEKGENFHDFVGFYIYIEPQSGRFVTPWDGYKRL